MERVKQQGHVLQAAIIGLKLLLICAIVAGVVSFVYELTADVYAQKVEETKTQAIGKIFGLESLTREELTAKGVNEKVYKVFDSDKNLIGYCVEVKSAGFGGDIEMMVGYNDRCEILSIGIISLSETPGLGSKVSEPSFLSQFNGKADQLELGVDVDAISGATISSTAVTNGVNKASESLQKVLSENGGAIR